MLKWVLNSLTLALIFGTCAAQAQEPTPTIITSIESIKRIKDDLQSILTLGGGGAQFKTLDETIDLFLVGATQTAPAAIRTYIVGGKSRDVLVIPVASAKEFAEMRKNLADLDIRPKINSAGGYDFDGLYFGAMRYDAAAKVVLMCSVDKVGQNPNTATNKANQSAARSLVASIKSPAKAPSGAGLWFVLDNTNTKITVADRHKTMSALTENLKFTQLKEETAAQFALRQESTKQNAAELERFFAEAARVMVSWNYDAAGKSGVSRLELTALPDTPLAATIEPMGKTPDEFALLPREKAVLAGHVNFALDAMRKGHLLKAAPLWKAVVAEKVGHEGTGALIAEVIVGVAELEVFNSFTRTFPNEKGEGFTTVGAARVANAKKIDELLKKLSMDDEVVKASETKIEGLTLYTIDASTYQEQAREFLAKDGLVWIAVSEKSIWVAAGEDAGIWLTKLSEQVKAGASKEGGPLVDVDVRLGPGFEVINRFLGDEPRTAPYRAALKAGLSGPKDSIHVVMTRDGDLIRMDSTISEGVLKAVGGIIAQVVREKIEQ